MAKKPGNHDKNVTEEQAKRRNNKEGFLEGVSVKGQTGDKCHHSLKKSDFFSRLIGNSNISTVEINGKSASALIDSGSMITTLSEEFYNSLDPKPDFVDIGQFNLKI